VWLDRLTMSGGEVGLKRLVPMGVGLPLTGVCWALIWTQDTFWNPLFFMGMWSGATLVMYGLGQRGYPGLRRHLTLLLLSVPLWWWFELANARVGNWEYLGSERYNALEYSIMASVAFSTVIPALDSAWSLTVRGGTPVVWQGSETKSSRYIAQIALGVFSQVLVFAAPAVFYPLVWVAPFLVADGIVGNMGGRSLVDDVMMGRWRLAVGVAVGGLLCGFLWEFWNFWATPKWVYHVPLLGFWKVFEMPILGYGGYVPFAWSVYQLTRIGPMERFARVG